MNKDSKIYVAGHRGLVGSAIWNNLLKEDYLNITVSVNFNEMWFWKNKIR